MPHYSILIFDEGLSAQTIYEKFSEQELASLLFLSNGKGGVDGAIEYLSTIEDQRGVQAFLISSVRKQAEQSASEQQKLVEALRDTSNAINQSLKLREVLETILNKVGQVVPSDAANIMLVEDGIASMAACRGYEKLGGEERVMTMRRAIKDVPNLRRISETGQPIVIPDTRTSRDWINFNTSTWIRSYASVPISHKGRTIGFLNLNSGIPNFYTDSAAERLMAFADQAAIAIENARLYEKAQQEIADRKRAEEALQVAMNELEERVAQRTAELSNANDQLKRELARRRQAEQALEQERALLASRIEERTAELSSANAELAKVMRLKDSFLANMSHELRTPLNAILNITETLMEEVYGPMNEQQMRSLQTVEDSGRHLLTLINDILDLSKIGAGKFDLNLDMVPVHDVCQASLKLIDEAARKKQLRVSASFDPAVKTVWADQRRLKQILLNLLSNAVKFTPAGGSVGLVVAGDAGKKTVQFTVWDTGIGIPEESLGSLFKPFVQLDHSLARQYEGTGLGLALVYHIVELHGGGIRVESEAGKGSRFIISLDWSEEAGYAKPDVSVSGDAGSSAAAASGAPAPATLPEDRQEQPAWQDETALLVEISHYLQEMGIEQESAAFDKAYLADLAARAPDFFLMHRRLAERGALAALRQEAAFGDIPVLLIDDLPAPGAAAGPAASADAAGAGDFDQHTALLQPPVNRQSLRAVIRQMSPRGTASLIHRAALLHDRPDTARDKTTILVADDNEHGVRAICDYLAARGYRVVRAYNGAEAVERARETLPGVILMDVQMPGMDGLEAIRRIRADARISTTPVIAFTALAMPGDRLRCLKAGANDYLSKPLSLKHLVQMIDVQLQAQAPEDTLSTEETVNGKSTHYPDRG